MWCWLLFLLSSAVLLSELLGLLLLGLGYRLVWVLCGNSRLDCYFWLFDGDNDAAKFCPWHFPIQTNDYVAGEEGGAIWTSNSDSEWIQKWEWECDWRSHESFIITYVVWRYEEASLLLLLFSSMFFFRVFLVRVAFFFHTLIAVVAPAASSLDLLSVYEQITWS